MSVRAFWSFMEKPEYLEGVYQMNALEEVLPDADIVVCTLPETTETYHLLDERKRG